MTEPSHTVFLSYASQDAPAAQRIYEALRAAGIAVWFDQSELRGGDAWDESIRRQIKSCALFIAVISSNTNERDEGYFRLEWKLAVDRSHLMAGDRTFLLPVVVDETRDDDERVPEYFREVQWTHLPGGETPAVFVERVLRLLTPADPHAPAVPREVLRPLSAATPPVKAVAPVPRSKRRLFLVAAVVPVVAVALLASIYFMRRNPRTATVTAAASGTPRSAAFNPPAGSLVVLPFKNLSGQANQEYFSDGITEELTDALGQNPALRVIAWATASRYRNAAPNVADIGQQLNVANLLNGSIERQGDAVRVTAELVDTRSGQQLWSQHYDNSFADIFKVQDQVSAAIAAALKVKFAQADLSQGGTTNPQAHELVLKGRARMDTFDDASLADAQHYFERAIALDPDYAEAHALLSHTLLRLTENSDLLLDTTFPTIRAQAEKAVALDPNNADAWVALGNADSSTDPPDFAKARADYGKALALDPSNANAHIDYGLALPLKEDRAQQREAVVLDPTNEFAWFNLSGMDLAFGDWTHAVAVAQTLLKLDPQYVGGVFCLAFAYRQLHQYDKMIAAFDRVQPATPMDKEQVSAGRLTYRALRDPTLRPQALAALKALAGKQNNSSVEFNLLQLYLVLGEAQPALQTLEEVCSSFAAFCNSLDENLMLRPLRGDPRFEALAKKYTAVIVD